MREPAAVPSHRPEAARPDYPEVEARGGPARRPDVARARRAAAGLRQGAAQAHRASASSRSKGLDRRTAPHLRRHRGRMMPKPGRTWPPTAFPGTTEAVGRSHERHAEPPIDSKEIPSPPGRRKMASARQPGEEEIRVYASSRSSSTPDFQRSDVLRGARSRTWRSCRSVPRVSRRCQGGLHPAVPRLLAAQGHHAPLQPPGGGHRARARRARAWSSSPAPRAARRCATTSRWSRRCVDDPQATMLYLFPTKALDAGPAARRSASFTRRKHGIEFLAGAYDGDTPQNLRRKLRDGANVILTNPDMLHQGILPQHARWNRFFTHLRYVVIDEVHAYRGVFGSHLANVHAPAAARLRALRRDPAVHLLLGHHRQPAGARGAHHRPADGAGGRTTARRAGPKRFVLWNPPPLTTAAQGNANDWRVGGDRRSPLWEAVHLMSSLVQEGIQTIAFVRTRLAAELIFKNCRDLLQPISPQARRLRARLPRRLSAGGAPARSSKQLVDKEILGVASTNALELGIDIGSLDACLLVGYPGTIASLWQQAGPRGPRARGGADRAHRAELAHRPVPDDALRLPLRAEPGAGGGGPRQPAHRHRPPAVRDARAAADATKRSEVSARTRTSCSSCWRKRARSSTSTAAWYWASTEYPAAGVNLRNIAGPVYTIQEESEGERVIGTMDEVSALTQLHTHAVYLHAGDTYFVNKLDLEQKIAHVARQDLDYYTQSVQVSQIKVDEVEEERGAVRGARRLRRCHRHHHHPHVQEDPLPLPRQPGVREAGAAAAVAGDGGDVARRRATRRRAGAGREEAPPRARR